MRFTGKTAIVTGAGQGIGRAIALGLAKEGADIVVNDINLELAHKVADEIKVAGRRALAIKADVSNSAEVSQMVKETIDNFKKVDILVNNAGIDKVMPAEEMTEDVWDAQVNTNLKGPFLCSQAVGRQMIKQKQGKIINIASLSGHYGSHGQAAYCASKAGVILLTMVLAVEWAKYNINVNAVSPGITRTALIEKLEKESPKFVEGRLKRIPIRRFIEPEEIASVALFLASSESDAITGEDIVVDGGVNALNALVPSPEE